MRRAKPGFTLVELLVVIAIIGVLVSLLLPAVQSAREAARRTQCANNLRQIAVALHNYHDNIGRFPPGGIYYSANAWPAPTNYNWRASWLLMLLPQLEQQGLYDQYDFNILPQGSDDNRAVVATSLKVLICPSTGTESAAWFSSGTNLRFAKGNYGACFSAGSGFSQDSFRGTRMDTERAAFNASGRYGAQLADIKDGTSNVIAVAEILNRDNEKDYRGGWAHPHGSFFCGGNQTLCARDVRMMPNGNANDDCLADKIWGCPASNRPTRDPQLYCITQAGDRPVVAARSYHPGGVHAVMCDGSVRFISDSIEGENWKHLLCIHDGETVDQF